MNHLKKSISSISLIKRLERSILKKSRPGSKTSHAANGLLRSRSGIRFLLITPVSNVKYVREKAKLRSMRVVDLGNANVKLTTVIR